MFIRKYVKHVIFVAGLVSMAAIFSRCTSSGGSSASPATSFAISGTISVGQTASSISSMSVNANAAPVIGDVNAQATACNDGYFYNVYCVSYSEPPVAANGAVTCGGTNSGSFTVSGLPLNAEIGCFVRRAATDSASAYSTIGTIEIPTASLSGGTTTLVSQGDLNLAIDLNTDGSITTTVTGGGDNVVSPVESGSGVDTSKYTGFWSIQCDSSATGDLVDPVRCKCQNGGQEDAQYDSTTGAKNPTHINPEDACIADNASEVSDLDTQQYIEINMYTASPQSNLTIENGAVIPSGTLVPIISVWSANSSSTSKRGSGGEGASTSVKDKNNATVNLTWSSAQATNPIAWTNTDGISDNGVTLNFSTSAALLTTALSTPNAGNWKAWAKSVFDASSGFVCTWGSTSSTSDAGCLSEFTDRHLAHNEDINVPTVRIERRCDNTGCDADISHAIVNVDGYHADYNGVLPANIDAVVLQHEGVAPELRTRYVFEPFEATPSGGGFTQHHFNNRNYSCDDVAGKQIQNAACDGNQQNWVNCGIREEMSIKFKPTSPTAMTLFFESRGIVAYATLEKWNSGTGKTMGTFAQALALCDSQNAASEARFQMTAAKQP